MKRGLNKKNTLAFKTSDSDPTMAIYEIKFDCLYNTGLEALWRPNTCRMPNNSQYFMFSELLCY